MTEGRLLNRSVSIDLTVSALRLGGGNKNEADAGQKFKGSHVSSDFLPLQKIS